MTRKEVQQRFATYLKSHNIKYVQDNDFGKTRYTIVYGVENAPGKCVESCIWFYEDIMEVRVYYCAVSTEICRKSNRIADLLSVLNYINARVFMSCSDGAYGLYKPHMLYTPRMYLTADDCYDITITTVVNYDFYEVAPVETEDYITKYCPELLDRLAYPIYGVLLEKITAEEAIKHIEGMI